MRKKSFAPACPGYTGIHAEGPHETNPGECPLLRLCADAARNDSIPLAVEHSIARNQPLFKAGDPFHGVYVLRTGAFKNIAVLDGQEDQVVDFRLPGDVLGISAMGCGRYSFSALALEPSLLCRIDIDAHADLAHHHDLIVTLSRQLQRAQWASVQLRTQSAEQRVIHFLLDMDRRAPGGGAGHIGMKLPMSRKDIANYLGVAVETVSRILHRLQGEGLLSASGRNLKLFDRSGLVQRLEGSETRVCA